MNVVVTLVVPDLGAGEGAVDGAPTFNAARGYTCFFNGDLWVSQYDDWTRVEARVVPVVRVREETR